MCVCLCVCVCVRARGRVRVCVALVSSMQCACALLSCLASPAVDFFPALSHKWHDFRGGGDIENKMFVLVFLYNFCLIHFSY